jgi:uncharacterized protein (TIGR02246 family)
MKNLICLVAACVAAACGLPSTFAADQDAERAAIEKTVESYTSAFNAQDAQKLAEHWGPDAVYTNRLTGQQVTGRGAIAEQFAALFETGGELKLEVQVGSIEFLSPNVAIEKGIATFVSDAPETIPYSAVYVKREGKWLLDRVTDDPQLEVPSRYEQLKPLEWMIGSWADQDDTGSVQAECSWTKNKSFMTRSFTVSIPGQLELSGMQIIGWDAGENGIRSWTFDSDGGFAEARWSNNGNQWYVIKKGTTADGKAVAAVNVMTHLDDNTFTLKSVQRSLNGQVLPDLEEVTVVRQ